MPNILIYIETADGVPSPASAGFVAGARSLAGPDGRVAGVVFAPDARGLETLQGADEVIVAALSGEHGLTSESTLSVLRLLIEDTGASLTIIPNSPAGIDLGAALAAATDLPFINACAALKLAGGCVEVRSRIYGGRAEALVSTPLPAIVALNAGALSRGEPTAAPRLVVRTFDSQGPGRIRVEAVEAAEGGEVDITQFEQLVCVGRGIGGEAGVEAARDLARLLGAELAASRQVTDRGWVEKCRQIGKSGKTVSPRVYLGLGVSGAPEHVEGMSESGLIIAINTDPSAPIFDLAHYGSTCDVNALLPHLVRRLSEEPR
jgi:electron transfer flavoprotein alpha subunit